MVPRARLRTSDGSVVALGPCALIGRAWNAHLRLDDPRVSEAHAMVSLRGGELWLLALRGRLAHKGHAVPEVRLVPGRKVQLARELSLQVVDVQLPDTLLALEADGLPRQAPVGVSAIFARPVPELRRGFHPDAPAHCWSDGDGWWARRQGEGARPLRVGDALEVDGVSFRAVAMQLHTGGVDATERGGVEHALRVVAQFDTVLLELPGRSPVVLAGKLARLVSELVALGGPVRWEVVADELWPNAPDRDAHRRRWDTTIARLRRTLRAEGMRDDLVQSVGTGYVELVRYPGDEIVDAT